MTRIDDIEAVAEGRITSGRQKKSKLLTLISPNKCIYKEIDSIVEGSTELLA